MDDQVPSRAKINNNDTKHLSSTSPSLTVTAQGNIFWRSRNEPIPYKRFGSRSYPTIIYVLFSPQDATSAECCEIQISEIAPICLSCLWKRCAFIIINAMRRECAACGTFWLSWLPLASSLAVPDFAIAAIRYRDAGKMWTLVRL